MGKDTKISWATHTHNFWVGCEKVGPACDGCYAEAWAKRAGRDHLWSGARERTKDWKGPPRWNRRALEMQLAGIKERPSVFANSLSDFFDIGIPPEWRWDAWDLIKANQAMDWFLVTKRIPNVAKMLPFGWSQETFGHVVIIITVVTQAEADRDIGRLLTLKGHYPWLRVGLSMEPLIEAVDLSRWTTDVANYAGYCDAVGGPKPIINHMLDWVIVGGESGAKARPMAPAWARTIRNQCAAAGVPFHFKQWGEFHFDGQAWASGMYGMAETPGVDPIGTRVGVAKTGRLLDGVLHDAGPRLLP